MGRLAAIVLGAAAGGGFPQWNCRCAVCRLAWAGDKRVKPRTQASLAVSADGQHWTLLNASPDLRAQIQANQNLQPRGQAHDNARGSPIAAVVLTGAEIDQTAGLLSLREPSPTIRCLPRSPPTWFPATPWFRARALCSAMASRRNFSSCRARCRFIWKA